MANRTLSEEQRAELDRLEGLLESASVYELFGIETEADANAVQDAYYDLSRRWHPDRFFRMELGDDGARIEQLFVAITHAYKVLSDPLKRRDYDRNELPGLLRRRTHRDAYEERSRSSVSDVRRGRSRTTFEARGPGQRGRTKTSRGSSAPSSGADSSAPPASGTPTSTPNPTPSPSPDTSRSSSRTSERPKRRSWREQVKRGRSRRSRAEATPLPRANPSSAAASSDAERVRAKPRRTSRRMERIKDELRQRKEQARAYYEQGLAELDKEQVVKAAASLYLATTYDSDNEDYKEAFEEANRASRRLQSRQLVNQAEAAESYQRVKEAIAHYRKAHELDPDNAKANYRLAVLIRRYEEDDREALLLLRRAVQVDPDDIDYRMALGDLYADLGMKLNAQREYRAVLSLRKGHEGAREGLKRVR